VINPETIKLPVWVIGVGLVHAVALALVLPMLITLPAPEKIRRKVEVVDIELVPAARLAPKIDQDVEQTGALSSPQPEQAAVGETTGQPVGETSEVRPEPAEETVTTPAEEAVAEPADQMGTEPADVVVEPNESAIFPTAAPDAVANVEPEAARTTTPAEPEAAAAPAATESVPTSAPIEESKPESVPVEESKPESKAPVPKPTAAKKPKAAKPKAEAKGAKAKAAKPAPKKPAVAAAKPKPKPAYRRTAQDVVKKGLAPFKGSWSQLLGGPTPVPAKR
jgi:hypothetical protein